MGEVPSSPMPCYVIQEEMTRPSVLFRPTLSKDGGQWRALYGSDPIKDVAGFGDTPEAAMRDFDQHWLTENAR